MNLTCRLSALFIFPLCFLAVPPAAPAQVASDKTPTPTDDASSAEAVSLQKKANEAQARIHENKGDSDQLKRAIKINEVPLAKEVLLRNGFTDKDLEHAKIILRTGGGSGGEDRIEISVTCCDPKEITIRRSIENFTK